MLLKRANIVRVHFSPLLSILNYVCVRISLIAYEAYFSLNVFFEKISLKLGKNYDLKTVLPCN